jgi:hypothetical protein
VWGKWKTGPAFNPVYAAVITSRVRCKVAELAFQSPNDIVGVAVDGLLSTRRLDTPKEWKLEYEGECVAANHGDYWIEGRYTKRNLLQDLCDHRWSLSYPLRGERFMSLAEAVRCDGFDGACREIPEAMQRVSKVGKRCWTKLPIVCGDLLTNVYTSAPCYPSGVMMVG